MSILLEIGILAIAAIGAALALIMLYGTLTRPVRLTEGQRLYCVLTVSGSSPGLEQTARGLSWLRGNSLPDARVVIADCGMDGETRAVAELIARDDERIILCAKSGIPENVL